MKFSGLSAVIRPRAAWEAADLGIVMLRQQWVVVYTSMLIFTLPFALGAYLLFQDHILYAFLLVWWFKPLYDRTTLFVIGHSLFDTPPTVRQTLKFSYLRIFRVLPELFLRLFDAKRSFNMPVSDLEGLKGSIKSSRKKMLGEGANGSGVGITLLFPLLEMMIAIALVLLVIFLNPEVEVVSSTGKPGSNFFIYYYEQYWLFITFYAFYVLSVVLIEPIYVACGFAQYINRRTYLEAWDIEIAFQKLAQRQNQPRSSTESENGTSGLSKMLLSIILVCTLLFTSMTSNKTYAETIRLDRSALSQSELKDKIKKVLARKEFSTKIKVKFWSMNFGSGSSGVGFSIGSLLEILLWTLFVGVVVAVIVYAGKYTYSSKPVNKVKRAEKPPEVLFGFDLRPESLPDDIVSAAQEFWRSNNKPEAISLLYRGALVNLIDNDGLELPVSATEGDCIRIVNRSTPGKKSNYFKSIVLSWQNIAYANRVPDEQKFNELCEDWPLIVRER